MKKPLPSYTEWLNESGVFKTDKVIPLSKIDKDTAKSSVFGGHKDGSKPDDKISSKSATVPVNKLKAAQTEIIPEKAIGMAIGMMLGDPTKIGGDLGSIISADNFIMDGHHRWAATFLCDPKGKVSATQIDLPGNALVTTLNIITVGQFDRGGNPGKGNIKDFTAKVIGGVLDEYIAKGIPGQFPLSTDDVKERLSRVPGANGDYNKGKEIMMKNANALPKDIMPGAPDRVEMPVIGPEEVALVKTMLKNGNVDIKEPFNKDLDSKI